MNMEDVDSLLSCHMQDSSRGPVPGDAHWAPERPGRGGGLRGQADLPDHKLPPEAGPRPREAGQGRYPAQNRFVALSKDCTIQ